MTAATKILAGVPGLDAWTLGASEAKDLLAGRLAALWEVATGRKPRPDLSGVLAVQLGSALEGFHVTWFSRRCGYPVGNEQFRVVHPALPLHATLDGLVVLGDRILPWEGKTCGKDGRLHELLRRYHGQLCQQSMCWDPGWADNDRRGVLSILFLNTRHDAFMVHLDPALCAEIRERAAILGHHVESDTRPADLPAYPVPLPRFEPLAPAPTPTRRPAACP